MTPVLYAYHVARAWLAGPLDPGAVRRPCWATWHREPPLSLPAIGRAGAYLARGGQRPRVPRMLVQAALVALVTHILAYAVSGVDLWLHTVAATVVQTVETPSDVPLSRSFAQTKCQPYASNSSDDLSAGMTRCIGPFTGPEASAMLGGTQMAVMSNHSRDYQAHTLADAGDLAVLVDPTVNANMSLTMTTFGARATCTLLMPPQCTLPAGLSGNVTCNGFPPGEFPPFNLTADSLPSSTAPGASALFMLSSNCAGCAHVDPTTYRYNNQALATQGAPPENRYSLWLQMVWQHGQGRGPLHAAGSAAYLTNLQYDALLANCTLAFSNVTLAHRSGAYTVAAETPSNAGLADGLATATRVGTTSAQLLADAQGILYAQEPPDGVAAFLAQDLARLALGAASVLVGGNDEPSADNGIVGTRLAGRYPVLAVRAVHRACARERHVPARVGARGDALVDGAYLHRPEGH